MAGVCANCGVAHDGQTCKEAQALSSAQWGRVSFMPDADLQDAHVYVPAETLPMLRDAALWCESAPDVKIDSVDVQSVDIPLASVRLCFSHLL